MQILGVIGISGDVEEVIRLARIVVTVAQLMVENDIFNDIVAIKETRLNNFLYEWSQRRAQDYDEAFLKQAEYFRVDVRKRRAAALFSFKRVRFSVIDKMKKMLRKDDYIVRQSMDRATILFAEDPQLRNRIDDMMGISKDLERCYVGEVSETAWESIRSVEAVMKTAKILSEERKVISYDDLRLECLLSGIAEDDVIRCIMDKLTAYDGNGSLQDTILIYAGTNEDQKKTCGRLYVHRNTLNYRLDRIEELTGFNPRNGRDLTMLYIAVLRLRTGE